MPYASLLFWSPCTQLCTSYTRIDYVSYSASDEVETGDVTIPWMNYRVES